VPVSTTTNPVTQVAEVAVNNASMNRGDCPEAVAKGIISSEAPINIIAAKPSTRILGGDDVANRNILYATCNTPLTDYDFTFSMTIESAARLWSERIGQGKWA
jgi:hypothetical protein